MEATKQKICKECWFEERNGHAHTCSKRDLVSAESQVKIEKRICKKCQVNMLKKDSLECSNCRRCFCPKHIYQYVDGNNIAITKNARLYCEGCYRLKYGNR